MLAWVSVFSAVALMDIVYARYTHAVAQSQRAPASFFAVLIILTTGFATTSYVQDTMLLIPAAAGAFVGTWITVGRKRWN